MSKAVLISIRPKWCQKIASGEKTIEVRKNRPTLAPPFKCYIYCTREKHLAFMQNQTGTNLVGCIDAETAIPVGGFVGNGKVIGEFTCDRIYKIDKDSVDFIFTRVHGGYSVYKKAAEECCGLCVAMPDNELFDYLGHRQGYGWHISNLKIYDTPKALEAFNGLRDTKFGAAPYEIKRAPQSWCYVEEQK